jgi:hypothetical protein
MRENANPVAFFYQQLSRSIAGLIFLSVIALPLFGCGEHEGGGPIISSLSTSTEAPLSTEGGDDSNIDSNTPSLSEDDNQETDSSENEAEDLEAFTNLADPNEEEAPEISLTSTPSGVTAQMTWDVSTDANVIGYHVYYGKQSSGEYGSCSYEEGQTADAPPAIINGLEPNTPYFFAISAYGGEEGELESPCSNEVLIVTPPAQT